MVEIAMLRGFLPTILAPAALACQVHHRAKTPYLNLVLDLPRLRARHRLQTVATRQRAARILMARRSYRVAIRRKSFKLPNMRSMALRLR